MSYESKNDLEQAQSPYKKDEHYNDLEPQETHRRGSVFSTSGRRMSISDEVFGDITEGGPNYRDVSSLWNLWFYQLLMDLGRMDGYRDPYDQNPDRPGCAIHPIRFRCGWSHSWCPLPDWYRWYDNLG
jgi:hypothetical protein